MQDEEAAEKMTSVSDVNKLSSEYHNAANLSREYHSSSNVVNIEGTLLRRVKAKFHENSFPVTSTWQVRNLSPTFPATSR